MIGNMIEKVLANVICSLYVTFRWCLRANNALLNSYGYSLNQWVFRYNPNFPSAIDNKLPALEGRTSSKLTAPHLNALHSARRRFIETETDEELRHVRSDTRLGQPPVFSIRQEIKYIIREMIHNIGKVQEKSSDMIINKFLLDMVGRILGWIHVIYNMLKGPKKKLVNQKLYIILTIQKIKKMVIQNMTLKI